DELEAMREQQRANKEKPRYDGRCRHRSEPIAGVQPVIRFKNPTEGQVVVHDAIRGDVSFNNAELDDLVIARPDGTPTYNLTVVVDDLDMQMTHVIRGDDHLNNSPRQINIFRALGAQPPIFAHVPMILGDDGARLSKRHGAVSVMSYRDEGYLPEALLNYLVRLGWSHGDQEVFSLDEMVQLFDISDVNRAASSFNTEKLLWLNQHYIKNSPAEHVAHHLSWHLSQLNIDPSEGPALPKVVELLRERAKTLRELAESCQYFYRDIRDYDDKAARKQLTADSLPILQDILRRFENLNDWQAALIHHEVQECAAAHEVGMGKVAQPIRVALTGNTVSPSLDVTLELAGRLRTESAIRAAIVYINDHA
ncbi:MAG: glutamate--tRNA ligase, partial [Methylophaga sp.]